MVPAPDEWAAMPADDGPETWQRIDVAIDPSRQEPEARAPTSCGDPQSSTSRAGQLVQPVQEIDVVDLPEVEVSNVDIEQQSVEFDVSELRCPGARARQLLPELDASTAPRARTASARTRWSSCPPTPTSGSRSNGRSDLFFYGLTWRASPSLFCPLPWRLELPRARPDRRRRTAAAPRPAATGSTAVTVVGAAVPPSPPPVRRRLAPALPPSASAPKTAVAGAARAPDGEDARTGDQIA